VTIAWSGNEQFQVGGATADEHAFKSVNFDQTSRGPSRNSMRFAYSGPSSKGSVMQTYPKNGAGFIARNFYADGASGLCPFLGYAVVSGAYWHG
jgi:hypothetical protein